MHHNPKAIMTTRGLVNYLMSSNLCFYSSLISEIVDQWKLTCGIWAKSYSSTLGNKIL
ncbi:hypothetical protein NEOC84_001179|nr:hypothetical protein [Neochlamydia sp. AcF84]